MLMEKMENKTKCARIVQDEYGSNDYFAKLMPVRSGTSLFGATRHEGIPGGGSLPLRSADRTDILSVSRQLSYGPWG